MESKINKTLLKKLFLKPTPYDRKSKIYETLKRKIFPCEKVFVDFLSTADASEQLARAKYIVQRMCFEANFPPPYDLLNNLAKFEHSPENKSKTESYIPQDHYIHIVYMYLLGIYVFFYSRSINIALTNEFKRNRIENSFHLARDATEDFIDYWKYFCLFHDLAYPIEQLCNPKSTVESYDRYLKCFNNIFNCLSREILSECAARFLVLWQMINDDENNALFGTVLDPLVNNTTLKWAKIERSIDNSVEIDGTKINELFGEYKAVDKIHCYEHLKMLTGFVSAEDYIVVLFDAMTEQPIAIKSVVDTSSYYYFLKGKYVKLKQTDAKEYLDSEDSLPVYDFYIRYFFKFKKDSLDLFYLDDGSGSVFGYEHYRNIIDMLSARMNLQPEQTVIFNRITTSSELNTYIFQIYQTILSYINTLLKDQSKPFERRHITHIIIENNSKIIKKFIKDNFIEYFKTAVLSQLPFSDFTAAENSLKSIKPDLEASRIKDIIGQAVDDLFKNDAINNYKNRIKEEFSSTLINDLDNEKECNGSFIEFLFQCSNIVFSQVTVNQSDVVSPEGVDIQELFEIAKKTTGEPDWLAILDKYIKRKMHRFQPNNVVSLFEFVNNYKTDNYIFDHGIYGSFIFLLSIQYYFTVIDQLFDSKDPRVDIMSTLCWNVERSQFEKSLKKDNSYIIEAVLKSIFCHNLYSSELKKLYRSSKDWMYEFIKEPSNYFGMMIDSLQVWNRSKYYELSDVHWWPSFSSDNYDIDIKNNTIVLHVMDYGTNLSSLEKKFIKNREEYLKDFSSYITIDIVHA